MAVAGEPGDSIPSDGVRESYSQNSEFWVKIIRDGLDPYRSRLTDAAVLGALGPLDGLRVLDAGCGEGYLTRKLSAAGAEAAGVDLTPELIDSAVTAADASGLDIRHLVADINSLPFDDSEFDAVVCNHVLTDLPDPSRPIAEISRVLRPGGKFVAMMLHPCFYGANAEREAVARNSAPLEYFGVRYIEQPFLVSGITSPAKVRTWLHPLESYAAWIASAGMRITGLAEPHPSAEEMLNDPWWVQNFKRPLFLLITAERA